MKAAPGPFLKAMTPDREDLVVWGAWIFTWSWLAALCAQEEIPFLLGQALSRKTLRGGQATHNTIDAHQIAVLLRGGRLPQADVYPAELRATRDLLRRRLHRMRKRAERLAHLHNTHSQSNLPEIHQQLADKATRGEVAARFPAPTVQQSSAVALALLNTSDCLLTGLERNLVQTAKAHEAQTCSRLPASPGVGQILALVRLYERPEIRRCPRGQAFVSSGRLVQWANASAGTRDGTSGQQLGQAYLQWAVSEAAVFFLRNTPAGQQYLTR